MTARLAALAGIVGPLWFLGGTLVFASFRQRYDPLAQAISELGEEGAANAAAWNVLGFGVNALCHALFAATLWRALRSDAKGRWVAGLMAVAALALAASGAFRCDPGCPPLPATLTGILHNVVGLAYFALIGVLPLLAWRAFAGHAAWQGLARPSLCVGIALVALFLVGPLFGPGRVGAWQRVYLLLAYGWMGAVAIRLFWLGGSQVRPAVTQSPHAHAPAV